MGTDIHMDVETFVDGVWKYVPRPTLIDPHDNVEHVNWITERPSSITFARLAGVRDRGWGFKVIAAKRGIPDDISAEMLELLPPEPDSWVDYTLDVYHDFSWVLLSELVHDHYGSVREWPYDPGWRDFIQRLSKLTFDDGKDVRVVFFFDC